MRSDSYGLTSRLKGPRLRLKGPRLRSAASVPALVLFAALSSTPPILAQDTLIRQSFTGDVEIFVDVVSYKNLQDPSQTFVEIYYALERNQMEFIELLPDHPGVYSAAWDIETIIETEIGDRVNWNRWQQVSQDTTFEGTRESWTTYDIYWPPVLLKPGVYRFITTITDLNSRLSGDTKVGVDRRMVVVPDYSSSELTVSDIELAVRLGRASSQNKFVKSGLQVVPNPLRVYGVNLPVLSIYAEIYGLSEPAAEGEAPRTYTRSVGIEGLNVDYRHSFETVTKPVRASNDLIAVTNMNVGIVPRGDYRLLVEIVDNSTGQRAVREKRFWVISETAIIAPSELETIEMTDENIIRLRNEIEYLARTEELEDYDRRDPEGKRQFLIEFWKAMDPNPSTPENELRQEILRRFNYANEYFATPTQPEGWKTEQGRIWIVYGVPDDRIPHVVETGRGKPWVEWIYDQLGNQGRSFFIFVDTSGGFGSYRLFHTNVPGEIQNPNWRADAGIEDIPPLTGEGE